MKIGIFQIGGSPMACYDTLRLIEVIRQSADDVDILVGYEEGSSAGNFFNRLDGRNFKQRPFSYCVEQPEDAFRIRRLRTHSDQVYRFTDGGGDFMDLDGWILSGRLPFGRFASRRPFLLFNSMSIEDVHLHPPRTSVGWFETMQSASGMLFAHDRIGRSLLALAGATGVPSSFDPLPALPDRQIPSFPFRTVAKPYALYFPHPYSPQFIKSEQGRPPHPTYLMPMPELKTSPDRDKYEGDTSGPLNPAVAWSLSESFAVATPIDIDLDRLESAVTQAQLLICDRIIDQNDVRLAFAQRSGTPVLMLKNSTGEVDHWENLKQVTQVDVDRFGELEQAVIDLVLYSGRQPVSIQDLAPSSRTLAVLRDFFDAVRAQADESVA